MLIATEARLQSASASELFPHMHEQELRVASEIGQVSTREKKAKHMGRKDDDECKWSVCPESKDRGIAWGTERCKQWNCERPDIAQFSGGGVQLTNAAAGLGAGLQQPEPPLSLPPEPGADSSVSDTSEALRTFFLSAPARTRAKTNNKTSVLRRTPRRRMASPTRLEMHAERQGGGVVGRTTCEENLTGERRELPQGEAARRSKRGGRWREPEW